MLIVQCIGFGLSGPPERFRRSASTINQGSSAQKKHMRAGKLHASGLRAKAGRAGPQLGDDRPLWLSPNCGKPVIHVVWVEGAMGWAWQVTDCRVPHIASML